VLDFFFQLGLILLKGFHLLSLALAGVVCGETIALDPLNATLFLLVLGLCPLARRKVGFGLRKYLAPGFPLLGGLSVCGV
jgi:hypothetical protein